ncbi:uncharacterized protein LOC116349714 [Contarinia nasturtii]|uniref:uncharacterized protein LOC116349714 n=1 Tax=Contarinia nasturtii TaxID=265458 RepID=UPI0012D4291E|nr:uncharacterized protein LOC116349714 [Contarinia nasturtii]XP_031637129.1 uncharacterized protein LOC116349714 [Contarinia nasturtii]
MDQKNIDTLDLLWKKESRYESSLYVDIFRKLDLKNRYNAQTESQYFQSTESVIAKYMRDEKDNDQSVLYRKKGDKCFKETEWQEAIACYNQSLCFATITSEHIGIGYAKRAQCFFQLKRYEECLLDLNLARHSNYPRQYVQLLQMRERECIKLIGQGDIEPMTKVPKIAFLPSEKYHELANVLDLTRQSDGKWRFVATEDVKVGQVVLVESSFVSSYTPSVSRCCICSAGLTNLLPCSKCSKVLMCSSCNGSIIHQVECDAFVLFDGQYKLASDTFRSILLAMSLFENANKLMDFVEPIVHGDLGNFPAFISNDDKLTKYRAFLHIAHGLFMVIDDKKAAFVNYCALMGHPVVNRYFHTVKHRRFLIHLIFHHISSLRLSALNSIVSGLESLEEIDYTFILSRHFSHSCAPHVRLNLIEGHIAMTSVRPIRKGQTVHIAYNETSLLKDVQTRQEELKDDLGRKCDCERCKFEEVNERGNVNAFEEDFGITTNMDFLYIVNDVYNKQQQNTNDKHVDDKIVKRAQRLLDQYGYQEWNSFLEIVFFYYYSALGKKSGQNKITFRSNSTISFD